MTSFELRQLETIDLKSKVEVLREDLFKVKFQHATAQLSDVSEIKQAKRSLARALTILREREIEADKAAQLASKEG